MNLNFSSQLEESSLNPEIEISDLRFYCVPWTLQNEILVFLTQDGYLCYLMAFKALPSLGLSDMQGIYFLLPTPEVSMVLINS